MLLDKNPLPQKYAFVGHHLIAVYSGCNPESLRDAERLATAMRAAAHATGATVLNSMAHVFENGGLTMLFLLAESHASVHTYPECNACFIDFFTCGNSCVVENSDAVMRKYLQPKNVHCQVVVRDRTS